MLEFRLSSHENVAGDVQTGGAVAGRKVRGRRDVHVSPDVFLAELDKYCLELFGQRLAGNITADIDVENGALDAENAKAASV
jgi:hypothetical protein